MQSFSLRVEKKGIVLLVILLASDMVEEDKDLGDLEKRLHAWSWLSRPERRLFM